MKNILVPIDFSEASINALNYAAVLANIFESSLVLLHAYSDRASSGREDFYEEKDTRKYESISQLKKANENFLKKEMMGIARKYTVKVHGIVVKGRPSNVIRKVAEKNESSLIVMGMKGSGRSNSAFGSTTISMIDKTSVPLLVIPEKAAYKSIECITVASDLNDKKMVSRFKILELFNLKFNPFIQLVNVQNNQSILETELAKVKMNTSLIWDKFYHSFNFVKKDNVQKGINDFLQNHPSEMLLMIAHNHNFIKKVLGISHTKTMTRQTKIPLLVLHE